MSTTTDKVKELGITKGEATAVDGTVYIDMASVVYTESPSRDWSEEHAMARLYCDAHNTAQKSGCLPSELLEQRDEAMRVMVELAVPFEGLRMDDESRKWIAPELWDAMVHATNAARSFLTRIKQGKP